MPPPAATPRLRLSYLLIAVAAIVLLWTLTQRADARDTVAYSELVSLVEQGKIKAVEIGPDEIVAEVAAEAGGAARRVRATRLPGVDEDALVADLRARKISVTGRRAAASPWAAVLGWLIPIAILLVVSSWFLRRTVGGGGPLGMARTTAKVFDVDKREKVTFADIAGIEEAEAELVEIVDFLKDPARYRDLGARAPRGVLLVGPPGTGKTLLARALAGEAGVAFFSISGSEFVQMFVGVGAARVRDLFEQAKQRAPCIVFIDELDAVGRSRSGVAGGFAAHEEREQTLNQLLVEMDGFDTSSGVVILAATNRPELLDPALLRAGRFDRLIPIERPELAGRAAILAIHARKVKTAPDVDLDVIARRTPGMAGAELATVVNEAALAATRRRASQVETRDFEEAIDRLQLGLKRQGRVMSPDEKRRAAIHESGHALVALSVPNADPVHRVTIIPRSIGALGATLQLPSEEHHLLTAGQLTDRLCVLLGGRTAEELLLPDVSTGASDDLERATELARQMVCKYGMSARLGPQALGRAPLGWQFGDAETALPPSERTAERVDDEVHELLTTAQRRARGLLDARRPALEAIAARLIEVETLDRAELEALAAAAPAAA